MSWDQIGRFADKLNFLMIAAIFRFAKAVVYHGFVLIG
jgi:hypothetical protein